MIGRRGTILLAATAVCVGALAPTRVADSRLPRWFDLVAEVRQGLDQAGDRLRAAFHLNWTTHKAPSKQVAETGPAALSLPGLVLEKPQASEEAAALTQAYSVAVANERIKMLGIDPAGIEDALAAYHAENLAAGDAAAQKIGDPLVRTALEWTALRDASSKVGLDRLKAFQTAHLDWPAPDWLRHQVEARLLRVQDPRIVESFFATDAPDTALGKLALAKALRADGRGDDAARIARAVFRESDLPGVEAKLKSDFGADLTKSDYKYRADRLLYKEQVTPALHLAALAGPDVLTLAKARAAVIAEAPSDKAIAAVPASLRRDPGLLLQEIQKARRAEKIDEAAALMKSAPRDPETLIDGDEWWTERRVLARKLLDAGNAVEAYAICANHSAVSRETKIEAEFHAGWIALRFMNDPSLAAPHFDAAAKLAETPTSIARIAYWQGRDAENSIAPDAMRKANAYYAKAAEFGSTYYGQLARRALGLTTDPLQEPVREAVGARRAEAVRVVELLYAAGEKEAALALAIEAANNLTDETQAAALAGVIARQHDAHLALTIGKLMGQRGLPADPLAFPTFGIPPYEALENSAPPSVVYSVARQESAFMPAVISKAGAKGLMQMIDSTARRTATRAGLPFDSARMLSDAAFNAQLGAAHLGELLAEQGGSYILTFAAYNAGGGRVKDWIEAYGDPRTPGVDPIDWVERIPFTETRNYVQRVMANVGVYRAIFAEQAKILADAKAKGETRADREAKL